MVNAEQSEPADSTDDFDDECEECGRSTAFFNVYSFGKFCQRCAEMLDAEAAGEEGK